MSVACDVGLPPQHSMLVHRLWMEEQPPLMTISCEYTE